MGTDDEDRLAEEVDGFVGRLAESLIGVVPAEDVEFRVEGRREDRGPILTIRQSNGDGLPLRVGDEILLRLDVRLQCAWNATAAPDHRFLAVVSSSYRALRPVSARRTALHVRLRP